MMLQDEPIICAICGEEIEEGSHFDIFINPEYDQERDSFFVVIIGECCEEKCYDRGEEFDPLAVMALYGQVGFEEN